MASFDSQGWLDGALKRPGPGRKTSGLRSKTTGIVMHSAVGYWAGMKAVLDGSARQVSWHFSNLIDGKLIQHYSVATKCWHASAGNDYLVGMEQEGGPLTNVSETLTDKQIDNCATVAAALRERYGWVTLTRSGNKKNLWEHNEVPSNATQCPSGRIPWSEVLRRALTPEEEDEMAPEHKAQHKVAAWFGLAHNYALDGAPLPKWLHDKLTALLALG